ncbi:predicted protein [Uncinocarpus reesii 1704]|uniref:MHYT domain-containing protein n=1 Tax=Uncinocarpus reesii (strain UAMH 1704) TaxID=336963 RepID=C4JTD1_UNCRE|nr:uncharacterized protein UREG_05720 [Uncinocarpus reesii 1704]EEP80878.1 predicted protein [Uncinocarpus reesii 1704]
MAGEVEFGLNDFVPVSYSAGFIVLSYLVSLAGCATCLELLHRRTSRFGLYNWYLLISAAVCMGGIGIWCMHFIGNRATILHHGANYQISYSSAFTAVSFLLPIVVLMIAFYFIGASERAELWYIVLTGVLTGAAVCGMHYVGQLGIANYTCSYKLPNVIGAAVIAVAASITALGVFFRMRASWTNSWWKRVISATILAIAVSGMHWTAAVGTLYRVKNVFQDTSGQLSSSQTVIVCTTLSCASCAFLIVLAVLTKRRHKKSANRVRQLVLASAFFDSSGRVMVSPEGLLPSQKITNQYIDRTFADDEFSKTHPAFIWAFRASRNWAIFRKLIPGMKYHLLSDATTKAFYPGNSGAADGRADIDLDFESVFKELFCVAAQELADRLHQPLEKMGELYDDIIITGTQSGAQKQGLERDLESVYIPKMLGKGQFLFTVRQLSKEEAAQLSATGWSFAARQNIAPTLARSMQIPPEDMLISLENMRDYSDTQKMMEPGVHLICFSLHPSVRKGFDVLVCEEAPNILPHVTLPIMSVSQRQIDFLSRMDDWPLTLCLRWLKQTSTEHADPELKAFCQHMYNAIVGLADLIDSPAFGGAKFSARRIMIPCRSTGQAGGTGKCTAFSFRIINGLQSRTTSPQLCLTPLRLFTAQQQVYPGIVDHANFQQTVLEEFGYCAAYQTLKSRYTGSANISSSVPSSQGIRPGRRSDISKTTTSEADDSRSSRNLPWGSIMVSNQVTVDIVERQPSHSDDIGAAFEMQQLGVTAEASWHHGIC